MPERLWGFHFPDQTCRECGLEHPGEDCRLQDGLPLSPAIAEDQDAMVGALQQQRGPRGAGHTTEGLTTDSLARSEIHG